MTLTPRVIEWRDRGEAEEVAGRRIHVFRRDGKGPLLLLLHGFPSSSYDWRFLLEELPGRAVLAYDCLGFGLSEKPRDHDYTLGEQADIAEELVARHGEGRPVFLVGHDMGTSVATELMARDLDGAAGIELVGGMLFNGSMIQSAASPTLAQRLLRGPAGPGDGAALERARLPPAVRLDLLRRAPAERRRGGRPVEPDRERGRPAAGPRADLLHGRARAARGALARRAPGLAAASGASAASPRGRRPCIWPGRWPIRWRPRTCSTACWSCGRRRR